MSLDDDKREFGIRYYRWALDQWRTEIDEDFPLLRLIRDADCAGTLELMRPMSRDERWIMAGALLKLHHSDTVAALGEAPSPEEREMLDRWKNMIREIGDRRRDMIIRGWDSPPRKKRIAPFRAAIKRIVVPLIGKEIEDCHGALYRYAVPSGRWTIVTTIDFTDRSADVTYDHMIWSDELVRTRSGQDVPARLADGISVERWFGVSSSTRWENLSDEEIPGAAAVLASVCRRFLEAVPGLLPG